MKNSGLLWVGLLCGLLLIWRYEDTSKHASKPPTTKPAPVQPVKPDTKPNKPKPKPGP